MRLSHAPWRADKSGIRVRQLGSSQGWRFAHSNPEAGTCRQAASLAVVQCAGEVVGQLHGIEAGGRCQQQAQDLLMGLHGQAASYRVSN